MPDTIVWTENLPVHIANPVLRDSLWCCRDNYIRSTKLIKDVFTLKFLGFVMQDKLYVFVRIKASTMGRSELRLYDKNSNFLEGIQLNYVNRRGETVTLANADVVDSYYLMGTYLPLTKLSGASGEVRLKVYPRGYTHDTKDFVFFAGIGDVGDFWIEDFPDTISWTED